MMGDLGREVIEKMGLQNRQKDFELLGRLFHNSGPLTLNLLNPYDFRLWLLGTSFLDSADLSYCFWAG